MSYSVQERSHHEKKSASEYEAAPSHHESNHHKKQHDAPEEDEVPVLTAEQTKQLVQMVNQSIQKCAVTILDLASMEGEWVMAYYREPTSEEITVRLQAQTENTITGTMIKNGGKQFAINLIRPEAGNPMLLNQLSLKNKVDVHIPVLVLGLDPSRYITILQAGLGHPKTVDWAIYVPLGNDLTLSESELGEALSGLDCLYPAEEQPNGTLVYPVEYKKGEEPSK